MLGGCCFGTKSSWAYSIEGSSEGRGHYPLDTKSNTRKLFEKGGEAGGVGRQA